MGKVKIRVVGDEQQEKEQQEEQKKRREAKKTQVKGVNLGGGERINTVGVSEEEISKELDAAKTEALAQDEPEAPTKKDKKTRGKKQKDKAARVRSKRHSSNSTIVANKTAYPIGAGIEVLRKFKKSNFDETVELHINVHEKGVSGQVSLPHGTGKQLRIKVVDDATIAEIEKGKINFDVLVATPDMMPKLAKVARVLGPRGLMPNPKAGTVTDKPDVVVERLSKGQVSYKTEPIGPIIHMSVGKLSFEDKQIEENVKSVLSSIGATKITSVTLKSTMSPAVRIQI